ncbi:MAG: SDR family oxidoreductase [Bacteroidales bacterium]
MNVLLTGVTGYIGGRMLPVLLDEGHTVYACVRDKLRFPPQYRDHPNLRIVEVDFMNPDFSTLPSDIDAAYYLIHSMTTSLTHFDEAEERQARSFTEYMNHTRVRQVIYLSGITAGEHLSQHLSSRKRVGEILAGGNYALTILRAAIISGAGSASFEIMYDLVDKLPVMIGPDSLNNECQPIGVVNVVYYLKEVLLNEATFGQTFDIGGPEILTYRKMLEIIAEVRHLKRRIYTVNWISARLAAHWFYFITSASYKLAVNLSDSMKNNVICQENRIRELIPQPLLTFRQTVEMALEKIASDNVLTSWKDSFSSSGLNYKLSQHWKVPEHGVQTYEVSRDVAVSRDEVLRRIWETGGTHGWWYANWLWKARGLLDLFDKGVGMRGRTNKEELSPGDALDFWRVLIADKLGGRLLLYAEMVMPGQGWLDFQLTEKNGKLVLTQKATFRPHGWKGRLYWLSTMPLHHFIFHGMIRKLTTPASLVK